MTGRRACAHRPRALPSAGRVAWYLLIIVLVILIGIAWTAVPEPELMACCK